MKTVIYVSFALAIIVGMAHGAAAQIITPNGPFSGTYQNAPEPQTAYYIATTDPDGNCRTLQVNATSLTQAMQIARGYCPNCSATDVTGEYRSGYTGISRPPAQYCPIK